MIEWYYIMLIIFGAIGFGLLGVAGVYVYYTRYYTIPSGETEKLLNNAENGSSSNNNNEQGNKWKPQVVDTSTESLEQTIEETFLRPLDKLAVHLDIPRLCRKFKIKDLNTEQVIFDGGVIPEDHEEEKRIDCIHDLIFSLFQKTGESDTTIQYLEENYLQIMNPKGDEAGRLLKFFQNFAHDTKALNILKLANQSILAAAVVRLKMSFGTKFPFKDMRGMWSIQILLDDQNNKAYVVHHKKEISNDENPGRQFDFSWNLTICLSNYDKVVSTQMKLDEINFGSNVEAQTKKEVMDAFGLCKCFEI